MAEKTTTYGIALRNFQAYPDSPDPQELIAFAERAEELGYESLWVWDHILLGVDPCFPIIDSLTLLAAVAARTSKIKLGTGILVLPLRNPVVLAKQIASIDRVRDNTGFDIQAADLETTEPPSARELAVLRELDPDRLYIA